MQKVKLPKQLDPVKNAVKRSEYIGVMMANDMNRLQQAVAAVDQDIEVEVKFEKDAQELTFFSGRLNTEVSLICQRCNESFAHHLEVSFCFSPVRAEQDIDELPEAYDPVEVDDHGEINLLQLFEDELILALPIVPFHAEEDCRVSEEEMSFGKIEPVAERPNPFAVLKELKRDQE
ncbi:23S rRNA accumulation protein YceD [Bowmanella dokdonensis]|uniref:Large ribosomal RNA subunit accumulation protein YceD n=1 Tax=Bowmanella dokdonensis TaxID=751969 RepID=A0A939IPZ0_9ALTE|nr:23S rRNA accumulation protein YceD [Bowmanella dokdonensis]MBN7824489.1 23S rRNA accumulation protein YceD [Bowmanella dokdonensis]